MSWKHTITDVSVNVIEKHRVPLIVKEVAWRALGFATRCRNSNPLSFALRPIFNHKRLHVVVGVVMALSVTGLALVSPLDSTVASENTGGGPVSLTVLPEGDINPTTRESVKTPVAYRYISQGFWGWHPGVDLATNIGQPVYPAMDGVVSQVQHDKWDYGKHVVVTHANKYTSLYAHLSKTTAAVGQTVTTANVIGEAGNTGRSTGPHLHLEIRDETNRPLNPATFLGIK